MAAQKSASLDAPLEMNKPSTIESMPILPDLAEPVTNLQMDYLFYKKSLLTKTVFKSKAVASLLVAAFAGLFYRKFGPYFTPYNFRNGTIEGLYNIYHSPFFIQDAFYLVSSTFMIFSATLVAAWLHTNFLKYEAEEVPKHMEQYFGLDLEDYAKSSVKSKLRRVPADIKQKVKFMEKHSFVIQYRDTPVAFIVQQKKSDSSFKITGLGVRRVYVKSKILADLLDWAKKQLSPKESTSITVYSFETFDIDILKESGFELLRKEPLDSFVLGTLFGITRDTYVYERSS
ncbi:hypothetical protein KL905_004352 [Ogataea polymorpha]|uniref:Uncharacterized protein n=2 Tax=Ogataea TaxID=461281 RepID=A0A1B7SHG9_9ASCO|nr:uncharacterized protein OGAPODRAFT_100762 [Ogataea polymorpha]AAP80569.1 Nii2p [Ogataea angusta]KAG7877719.1 hypothetical protein KL937_004589 [Ogataea polymorpha]KAG7887110.1 hypothetical protein KL936_004631 [Ogataea polymorpha]KAG7891312.1 hypothetical protein KL908_004065 [Ogataea polymorpha]KAG7900540.1 hypothetical protein KL907_004658 [Ogataea polymorpha]